MNGYEGKEGDGAEGDYSDAIASPVLLFYTLNRFLTSIC